MTNSSPEFPEKSTTSITRTTAQPRRTTSGARGRRATQPRPPAAAAKRTRVCVLISHFAQNAQGFYFEATINSKLLSSWSCGKFSHGIWILMQTLPGDYLFSLDFFRRQLHACVRARSGSPDTSLLGIISGRCGIFGVV